MASPTFPSDFTFSQSSLQDYSDCPRRFELRYLQQLQWPAVESEPALENERRQQEGQLFHRLAQQHLLGIPAEKLTPLASTPNLHRWWENYLGTEFDFIGYTKHAEITLSASILTNRLLAKYDLIAVGTDKTIIVDWKTYAKHPHNEWMAARLQTRVYRSLLIRAGTHLNNGQPFDPEQIEMVYWFAEYPSEPAHFRYDAAQYLRDWSGLEKLVAEIATAAEFPKTDDQRKCAYCPYRSYCERGIIAGQVEDIETELAEPDINLEQVQEIAL